MPWKQPPREAILCKYVKNDCRLRHVLSFHNAQNFDRAKYGEQICSLKSYLVLSNDTGLILLLKHPNTLSSSSPSSPMATDTILTYEAVCMKNSKPCRNSVTLRESQELTLSHFVSGKLRFKDIGT